MELFLFQFWTTSKWRAMERYPFQSFGESACDLFAKQIQVERNWRCIWSDMKSAACYSWFKQINSIRFPLSTPVEGGAGREEDFFFLFCFTIRGLGVSRGGGMNGRLAAFLYSVLGSQRYWCRSRFGGRWQLSVGEMTENLAHFSTLHTLLTAKCSA